MIRSLIKAALLLVLAGCTLGLPEQATVVPTDIQPTPTSAFAPFVDEAHIMSGICFEAAFDAAGQVFILRSAEDHIRFYDLADNSHLCRHPVERHPYDFSGGRVLAGLWSYGVGCTARHEIANIKRDDVARTLILQLQFITEGICNYELIRPFWIGIDNAADYEITIEVLSG